RGPPMSHVFVLDVPAYDRLLLVTDAAVNIAPDLDAKRDIVQNAIDLAHALGIAAPLVAILSAAETGNSRIPSTVDAAALCKMADRGQITGRILDGPLARSPSTTPPVSMRHGKKASSPMSPAAPTSWSRPISKPATSSPSSSAISRAP